MQSPVSAQRRVRSDTAPEAPGAGRDRADKTGATTEGGEFDAWLDRRLKDMYRTVLQEPLPPDIMDLLKPSRDKR